MKLLIALTVVLMATLSSSAPQDLIITQVDAIPPNAIQILHNGNFEADPPDDGWWLEDSWISETTTVDGDHSLMQGGRAGYSTAIHLLDGIDFSNYTEPIWLSRCVYVTTFEWPGAGLVDTCEGSFYTKEGMSVAYIWLLSNMNAEPPVWHCDLYRIDNLTEWGDELVLYLGTTNADDTRFTTCFCDVIEIWAVPKHRVFLPIVINGG